MHIRKKSRKKSLTSIRIAEKREDEFSGFICQKKKETLLEEGFQFLWDIGD